MVELPLIYCGCVFCWDRLNFFTKWQKNHEVRKTRLLSDFFGCYHYQD